LFDDADEFVGAVALAACELDELACSGDKPISLATTESGISMKNKIVEPSSGRDSDKPHRRRAL
jgi:hypothetical protein